MLNEEIVLLELLIDVSKERKEFDLFPGVKLYCFFVFVDSQ